MGIYLRFVMELSFGSFKLDVSSSRRLEGSVNEIRKVRVVLLMGWWVLEGEEERRSSHKQRSRSRRAFGASE